MAESSRTALADRMAFADRQGGLEAGVGIETHRPFHSWLSFHFSADTSSRKNLFHFLQCHDHRWRPALAIVRALVVRRQGPAVIGENALAAVVRCLPRPGAISESQCLRDRAPRVVKVVGAELIG